MTDLVVTPTYNERNNIRVLVEALFKLYPGVHVLVVDDNSPDGTAAVVRELQGHHPNLHLKERPGKLGLASAYLGAFKDALREYPDLRSVVTMDADLSHDPKEVAGMLEAIKDADLVIGSRYVRGGSVGNWTFARHLLSVSANWYVRAVTWSRVHDLTAGYCCYSAALLRQYDLDAVRSGGFAYQIEMKVGATRLGARIREIPITFASRVDGVSKISNNIIYEGLIVPGRFSPLARLFQAPRRG